MRFGSVCSGIEAASVAWPFWQAAWFSEIEPFPCAVLKHHYPDVPNHGDMTALPERILSGEVEAPDVFCGGTPCQAFSVAGNRKSLDDARGNLSLTFCEIADAIDAVRYVRNEQPTIIFWENVPGVLNTTDNAFGCFLAKLAGESCELQPPGGRWSDSGCVYGPKRAIAWRVLDAQYFGLAQRRRRVFVVASAREGFNPSEVLFEFSGERRDTAPSRKTGQGITADAETGFKLHETVGTLCADTHPGSYSGQDAYTGRLIPVISEPMCFEPRSPDGHARVIGNIAPCLNTMGGGQREPCVTYGIQGNMIGRADTAGPQGNGFSEEVGYTLTTGDVHGVATIAPPHVFKVRGGCEGGGKGYLGQDEQAFTITCGHDQQVAVANNAQYAVRRLTPVECERLQGFPDNYTNIPWRNKPEAPDGPRYKALGNSWAVPVVRWIGERVNFQILS
jgi:DNA (cytosine-5)-methyltransferase 1